MCKTLEPFEAVYGDDCPISEDPTTAFVCGAEATTRVEECGGRLRGPFCLYHAERVARGAHIIREAHRNCPRRLA